MHVPFLAVERPLQGSADKAAMADRRRTTLTRHQNHHVGSHPPPPGGYAITPFPGPSAAQAQTAALSRLQQPQQHPSYYTDPLGTSVVALSVPALPPPGGFPGQTRPPPYGSPRVGYPTRSSTGSIAGASSQRSSQAPRYPPVPSIGQPQSFRPPEPPRRPDSTPSSPYPSTARAEDPASRITPHEYHAPSPYELRWPASERRQTRPPQPHRSPQFQSSSAMPPPLQPRVGHRRASSLMEAPEETEQERQIKRRREGGRGS